MDELLKQALQGVDPGSPDAFAQIFRNLLALFPWWQLLWLNAVWVIVGVGIAWWRGSNLGRAFGWALLLGPIGWLIVWHAKPARTTCPRCNRDVPAFRRRCPRCGCRLRKPTPDGPAAQ